MPNLIIFIAINFNLFTVLQFAQEIEFIIAVKICF